LGFITHLEEEEEEEEEGLPYFKKRFGK